ncbi:hypothetical protein B0H19DRAFT_1081455 [Mycena capillaripes]|nr:hypothetical protein B0H19DRAFT_1081455 [Mycena capillaripes]
MSELPEYLKEPDEEAAASKLWAVYVSEAEKYDRALVESWKSNMEGTLIFAGLYSASLTAFIIESYKTLRPDSGDSTVQLLNQISQQLSAAANGSSFQIPQPILFTPSTTSLVCNALWFASLGLSLTCALIATLVEQWSRNFLHLADIRSAPVIRARIFSYLYYGLKRFSMHIVVDILPLLLHSSLFLFFAGLVAFLLPINSAIAAVAGGLLALLTAAYFTLTVLSLWYLDCPYRTPISGVCWPLFRGIAALWNRRHEGTDDAPRTSPSPQMETVVNAISRRAMEISPTRAARDYRALVWTVRSLADDVELEPFVEAIPEVLWGPYHRRHAYDDHIQHLLRDPDLRLQSRIVNLLRSCDTGLLSPVAGKRREISCYKALWAIATLQDSPKSPIYFPPIDLSELGRSYINDPVSGTDPERLHYTTSAAVALKWSGFCAVRIRLAALLQYLARCEADVQGGGSPDLRPVTTYLISLMRVWSASSHWSVTYPQWRDAVPQPVIIPDLVREITNFCANTPHYIMFDYYDSLGRLESPPYRWRETQEMIRLNDPDPSSYMQEELERALHHVVYAHLDSFKKASVNDDWVDSIIQKLCAAMRLDWTSAPAAISGAMIRYLNDRHSDDTIVQLLKRYNFYLWAGIPRTLSETPSVPTRCGHKKPVPTVEDVLTALWRVLSLWPGYFVINYMTESPPVLGVCESALAAVVETGPSAIAFSVGTMMKALIIDTLEVDAAHWRLAETANTVLPGSHTPQLTTEIPRSRMEAKLVLIADFLEGCSAEFVPYKPKETLHCILTICDPDPIYHGTIHETHQMRLARSMVRVSEFPGAELVAAVISTTIFDVYAGLSVHDSHLVRSPADGPLPPKQNAWLHSEDARAQIKVALACAKELFASDHSGLLLLARSQAIMRGLDSLHNEEYNLSLNTFGSIPVRPSPLTQFLATLNPPILPVEVSSPTPAHE